MPDVKHIRPSPVTPGPDSGGGESRGEGPLESLSTARRPKPWARVVLAIVVIALFAGLFLWRLIPLRQHQADLEAAAEHVKNDLPVVSVIKPMLAATSTSVDLPGDVDAVQQTEVFPRTSGYIKRWLVDMGGVVKAGDTLAEIDAPELDAELLAAKASVEQAKARLLSAQASLDLARTTFERYQEAIKGKATSEQELSERRSGVDTAQAAVAAAKADISAGEANVERLAALQGFEKVAAPFDGTITARNAEVGQLVSAGTAAGSASLFSIARTDPMRVFINVPQVYAASIKPGLKVKLLLREHPGRAFDGEVSRTAQAIDLATRTLRTEVRVPNRDGLLLTGMYGRVHFNVPLTQKTLLVPGAALVSGAAGNQLALVKDGKIHFQSVEVSDDLGNQVGIVDGLSPDDEVVANPGERITEGTAVKAAIADMPAAPPAPAAPKVSAPAAPTPSAAESQAHTQP